jgi:VCBS repeat protein
MVTWKLVGWMRTALASVLALAPLAAQHDGLDAAPRATGELAIDVDGDGRADRVRWTRQDDAFWLDVALAGAGTAQGSFAPRSTTRVAAATGWGLSVSAADVNRDGRMDVLVRDARGNTTAWVSDGLAFEADGQASPGEIAEGELNDRMKR